MVPIDRPALARRALLDALRVANLLDRRGGALARRSGITSAQWLSLGLLVQVGARGLTPTELCRQLCVSKQNMTGMIVRLEHKQLIERFPEPSDRRSFRVRVTHRGTRVINQLEGAGRDFFLYQVDGLGDSELRALADGLDTVLERLRQAEERAERAARAARAG
jgi:DNA-binding MarR family transcriptional regulator